MLSDPKIRQALAALVLAVVAYVVQAVLSGPVPTP